MTPTEAIIEVMNEHPSRDLLDIHIMRCETAGLSPRDTDPTETSVIVSQMLNAGQVRAKLRQGKLLYTLNERTVEPAWPGLKLVEVEEEPAEKLYLIGACGEAFDDMKIAYDHVEGGPEIGDPCGDCCDAGGSFHVVPEREAF